MFCEGQDRSRFGIGVIQLDAHRGEWIPEIVTVERSKEEFQNYIRKGHEDKTMYGFALAVNTNPVMVGRRQKHGLEFQVPLPCWQ